MKPVFALRGASFLAHFCAYAGRSRELDGSLIELGGHKNKICTYMQRRHYTYVHVYMYINIYVFKYVDVRTYVFYCLI